MGKVGYRIKSKSSKVASIYINFRPPSSNVLETRTGLKVLSKTWSSTKQRAKGNLVESTELNRVLDDLSGFVRKSYNECLHNGYEPNLIWFKSILDIFFNRGKEVDFDNILLFYQNYLNRLLSSNKSDNSLAYNTLKTYKNFEQILIEFRDFKGSKFSFKFLDKATLDLFYEWLLYNKDYKPTYIPRIVSRLKFLCKEALSYEINVNPTFSSYKIRVRKTDRYIQVLTDSDFQKIKDYQPSNTSMSDTRKWTLIGLLIGQRVSDLLSITSNDIRYEDGIALVDITQQKTGRRVTCGIKDDIVIDFMKNDFPKSVTSQTFNRRLKELCRLSGIDEEVNGYVMTESGRNKLESGPKYRFITSHDFRRSFATNSFYKNIPVTIIMGITGHKKESTFYDYINYEPTNDDKAKAYLNYL